MAQTMADDPGGSHELDDEYSQWQLRIDALRREVAQAERRREAAAAELRNLRLDHQSMQRQLEREQQTLAQAEKQRDLLLHTIERLRREVGEVRAAQRELEQVHGRSLTQLDEANSALAEMYRAQAAVVSERDQLARRAAELEAQLAARGGFGGAGGAPAEDLEGGDELATAAARQELRRQAEAIDRLEAELRRHQAEIERRETAQFELQAAHRELAESRVLRQRMEDEIANLNGRLVEMMSASSKQLRDLIQQHADAEQAWRIERQLLDPSARDAAQPGRSAVEVLVLDETPAGESLTAELVQRGQAARRLPYDPRLGIEVEKWGGRPTAVNLAVPGSWGAVRRLVWRHVTPVAPFYAYAFPPGVQTAFWLGPISFAILTHGPHGIGPVVRHAVPHAEYAVMLGDEALMDGLRDDLDQSQIEANFARSGQDARELMAAREPDVAIVHFSARLPEQWRDLLDLRTYVSGRDLPLVLLLDADASPADAVNFSAGMRRLAESGDLDLADLAATLAAWHQSRE